MLTIPQPLVPGDDGTGDAAVTSALAAFSAGTAEATEVIAALSGARLLVPVVALLTSSEVGEHGLRQEKESEMALPKLVGNDGREAVLAFTGAESLKLWRPDARPIQATTPQVCQAAAAEGVAAVVVDVAGPVPFVIEGGVLAAFAAVQSGTLDRLGPDSGVTVARMAEQVPGPGPASRRRRFGWPLRRRG
ncbi:SseB family protein [Planomonospora corallina]|uniref:SseB family protein n=1 Tax=Planomonospora corallina TaxID=1806052 RepID=A0ABV8I1T4_9ACTN